MKLNRKIWIALLLTIVLSLPFFVQNIHVFHFHETDNEATNECEHHESHDCETCAICKFILSPYTETESNDYIVELKPIPYEIGIYYEYVNRSFTYSYHLRAPPDVNMSEGVIAKSEVRAMKQSSKTIFWIASLRSQ